MINHGQSEGMMVEGVTESNQPVGASMYPDFYTSRVIIEPIDLSTILEKQKDGEWK